MQWGTLEAALSPRDELAVLKEAMYHWTERHPHPAAPPPRERERTVRHGPERRLSTEPIDGR